MKVDESERETLAAVSQTPVTTFGKLSNVSADTISEIRAGWTQKEELRRRGMAEAHANSSVSARTSRVTRLPPTTSAPG